MNSNSPIRSHGPSHLLQLWVFWLVLSVMLAQILGQLHAVKHVIQPYGQVSAVHGVGAHEAHVAHDQHDGHHAGHHVEPYDEGLLDALFVSHGSASDCRLYDHLCDGKAMPSVVAAVLPIVLPSQQVAIFAGDALARWAALFDARGPPLTV